MLRQSISYVLLGAGLALAGSASAEPLIRGSKAKVITTPPAHGAPPPRDSGYYVPYFTGPGGRQIPVMEIPGSVTVVPRELMDDQQANTLGQALRYVPGVTVGR